jgi:YVTN family beta-propeller protein
MAVPITPTGAPAPATKGASQRPSSPPRGLSKGATGAIAAVVVVVVIVVGLGFSGLIPGFHLDFSSPHNSPSVPSYPVTFTESGLTPGTSWSVTLNGDSQDSTGAADAFSEPNGTYAFSASATGYTASPGSGSIAVSGATSQSIDFTTKEQGLYSVTFSESGLSAGTGWSVTLGGSQESSTSTTIQFTEGNGTYAYTIGPVSGYAANRSGGSVHVEGTPTYIAIAFSSVELRAVATIPVSQGPTFGAYDTRNGYVYVTNFGSNNVSVLNGTTAVAEVPVGFEGGNQYVAYDPSNGYVYVPNGEAGVVYVLNGTSLVATVSVGSDDPYSAVFDPADGYVYVPNDLSDTVSVLSGKAVAGTVTICTAPYYGTYDAADGDVYVACATGNVSVLNGTKLVATIPVGGATPETIYPIYDPTNGFIYVTNRDGTVDVLSGTTLHATVPVGYSPWSATYDPVNGYVYILNAGSDNVSVLSGTEVVGTVTGVGAPESFGACDTSNGYVFVADYSGSGVTVISGTSVVGTVSVGGGPYSATFDPSNGFVYVTNYLTSTVSVLES